MNNYHLVTLPEVLVKEVSRLKIGTSRTRPNIYKFLGNLMEDSVYKKGLAGSHVNYGWDYLKDCFGNNYARHITALENAGILDVDHEYIIPDECTQGKTKAYAIQYKYLAGKYDSFLIRHNRKMEENPIERIEDAHTGHILRDCSINAKLAKTITLEHANSDRIYNNHRVKIGADQVPDHFFMEVRVFNQRMKRFKLVDRIFRDKLLTSWYNPEYTLIKNGKTVYYMPLQEYIIRKRLTVIFQYTHNIAAWQHKRFFAHRDSTTFRLHSNLTNTPKIILESCIRINGKAFKELDFANSQFMLFAYCLDQPFLQDGTRPIIENKISRLCMEIPNYKTPTTRLFMQYAREGKLYNEVAKDLGLKDRNEAKAMLFETLFNSNIGERSDSPAKAAIRKQYPDIIRVMDAYKRKYGYSDFPSELQRVESALVVDIILERLKAENIDAATKHDSFLIYPNHYERAKTIIDETATAYLGQNNYRLK